MIYTLTLNPSLDYIMRVEHLELGETNRSSFDAIYPGGKGINVATILEELGCDVCALGFIAGFCGQALKGMIEQRGLKTRLIELPEGNTRINVKLKGQSETEINGMGPDITKKALDELEKILEDMNQDDTLIISGSIPACLDNNFYRSILEKHSNHIGKIAVDASGKLLENVLDLHPVLVKPNKAELEELLNTTLDTIEDVAEGAKKLQEKGARNVLISLGKDGALLVNEKQEVYTAPAPQGKLINSVGSGDSMVAGFMAGLDQNLDPQALLNQAICCGSATAFCADLAKKEDIEGLLAANPKDRVRAL